MMRIHKLLLLAYPLLLFIAACSEEDPLPLPTVVFTTDPEIVEVGVPVTFVNNSLNASSYEWDFGDGQTSVEVNPMVIYEESGTFTVTLVAFTEDNQMDSISSDIYVGERVMTAMNINSISFVNFDGEDWDVPLDSADSVKYPDFIIYLGPQGDFERAIFTPPIFDLGPAEMPLGFTLSPGGEPYILTNETWELTFLDFDGEDINNPQNDDFEVMQQITFNPVTLVTSFVDEDGEGFVQISYGMYSVDLFFQIE